jgi:hypothetical protein
MDPWTTRRISPRWTLTEKRWCAHQSGSSPRDVEEGERQKGVLTTASVGGGAAWFASATTTSGNGGWCFDSAAIQTRETHRGSRNMERVSPWFSPSASLGRCGARVRPTTR